MLGRVKLDDVDAISVSYQSAELKRYEQATEFAKSNSITWVEATETCLLNRLKSQAPELELLTHAITILSTHGWKHYDDSAFDYAALDSICQRFSVPLDKADVDRSLVREECDDIVDYATRYLNIVKDNYKVVWWKLFNAFDSKK